MLRGVQFSLRPQGAMFDPNDQLVDALAKACPHSTPTHSHCLVNGNVSWPKTSVNPAISIRPGATFNPVSRTLLVMGMWRHIWRQARELPHSQSWATLYATGNSWWQRVGEICPLLPTHQLIDHLSGWIRTRAIGLTSEAQEYIDRVPNKA